MGRFLLGILTGFLLVILIVVIGVATVTSMRTRPPAIEQGSTLILHITGDPPEKPPLGLPWAVFEQHEPVTIENIWSMLRRAAADPRIKAVIFQPEGTSAGWAKMQEIHADLEQFRRSGKPLIAYLKAPGMRDYYMASACSKIYMSPVDLLDLKGLALSTMYFKDALDKLGVKVDVEHAGKYKDYGDMFVRDSMSPETREVLNYMADDLYGDLVSTVARGRVKDAATVRAIIDDGPFLSTQAKDKGLVDGLIYEDQAFGMLAATLHQKDLTKVSTQDYANVPDSAVGLAGTEKIAYVVAEGTISRGTGFSIDGPGLESGAFDKMLEKVGNDASFKGVIVRIDSPGGEVAASDDMWYAMNKLRKKKPMVISMGDDAASGGYYMAMSGSPLIAYPGTVTGSIGVVFGKPNLHGLYDKLGVTKDFVSRGRFALIDSDYESLSEAGKQKLKEGIDANYQDFIAKVAAARKQPVSRIAELAQGRVWLGDQAKGNGLVDELGGLDRAVEMIKAKSGIAAGSRVDLVIYPPKRSLLDLLTGAGSDTTEAKVNGQIDSLLSGVGLEGLRKAWDNASLRVWMRGGMLRMRPFMFDFR